MSNYSKSATLYGAAASVRSSRGGSRFFDAASKAFCSAARLVGVVPQRDLAGLQANVRQHRIIIQRAEEDMAYAKSINAELGAKNTSLDERNVHLERRHSQLEAENRHLEAWAEQLQAENMRLKEHNHSLFFSANAVRRAREFKPVVFERGGQQRA